MPVDQIPRRAIHRSNPWGKLIAAIACEDTSSGWCGFYVDSSCSLFCLFSDSHSLASGFPTLITLAAGWFNIRRVRKWKHHQDAWAILGHWPCPIGSNPQTTAPFATRDMRDYSNQLFLKTGYRWPTGLHLILPYITMIHPGTVLLFSCFFFDGIVRKFHETTAQLFKKSNQEGVRLKYPLVWWKYPLQSGH